MDKMTYNEYIKQLNQQGMIRMLGDMTEVPSLEAARQAEQVLLNNIAETSGLSKAKLRKASYSIAQVKFNGFNYLAFIYNINDAEVMLRATNLDTKKIYIPNDVWMIMTNRETDETDLHMVMSLSLDGINKVKDIQNKQ